MAHITLDGKEYVVADRSYEVRQQESFVPRFSTGAPDEGDLSFWQWFVQRDFRRGIGAEKFLGIDGLVHNAHQISLLNDFGASLGFASRALDARIQVRAFGRTFKTQPIAIFPYYANSWRWQQTIDLNIAAERDLTTREKAKGTGAPLPIFEIQGITGTVLSRGARNPMLLSLYDKRRQLWDEVSTLINNPVSLNSVSINGGILVWNAVGRAVFIRRQGDKVFVDRPDFVPDATDWWWYSVTGSTVNDFFSGGSDYGPRPGVHNQPYAGHGIIHRGWFLYISDLNTIQTRRLPEDMGALSGTSDLFFQRGVLSYTIPLLNNQRFANAFHRLANYQDGIVIGCTSGDIILSPITGEILANNTNVFTFQGSDQPKFAKLVNPDGEAVKEIPALYAGNLASSAIVDFATFNDRLYVAGYRRKSDKSVIGWVEGDRLAGSYEIPGEFEIKAIEAFGGRLFYSGCVGNEGYIYGFPHELVAHFPAP